MHGFTLFDGMSLESANTRSRQRQNLPSLGRIEMDRLLGEGRQFGHGPLARFVQLSARHATLHPDRHTLIMLYDESAEVGRRGGGASAVIEPLIDHYSKEIKLVPARPGQVPWEAIRDIIQATGDDADPHFLIVGFPTEGRILALGNMLRNMLGHEQVAVCYHLVGSISQSAHLAALCHFFPVAGVQVLLDIADAAAFIGLPGDQLADLNLSACQIEPAELRAQMSPTQVDIVQRLCMGWTTVELSLFHGGFSGSMLVLAMGTKGRARTEPMVIKIDDAAQMLREINGYQRVKEFIARQLPRFAYPVETDGLIGVGMELAAIEDRPSTLQACFEGGLDANATRHFMQLLNKALGLLSEKLYRNTKVAAWVTPFRELRLHTQETLDWLEENLGYLQAYAQEVHFDHFPIDVAQTLDHLHQVTANTAGWPGELCLVHGDLNYKNVLYDKANNLWFIDWTHTGLLPLEIDFAKLENDVKFVLSSQFGRDDLPRLKIFEDFLVAHRVPPHADDAADMLKFVKWDLRFRTMLEAVIAIRRACFALKDSERWLCYRVALLKFALHTLSFDQRRGLGECALMQLLHAGFAVEALSAGLAADDYQLLIDPECPAGYPERQRVPRKLAPWAVQCPDYDPPYHVDADVLENDRSRVRGGWANPEAVPATAVAGDRDDLGRPLNPAGRTGVAGRGLLGRWGANPAVCVIVLRLDSRPAEIMVGRRDGPKGFALPRRFVLPDETPEEGLWRVIQETTGYKRPLREARDLFAGRYDAKVLYDGRHDDPRQTDHAWVDLRVYLFALYGGIAHGVFGPSLALGKVEWQPMNAETINELDSAGAELVRRAVQDQRDKGRIEEAAACALLSQTGGRSPC